MEAKSKKRDLTLLDNGLRIHSIDSDFVNVLFDLRDNYRDFTKRRLLMLSGGDVDEYRALVEYANKGDWDTMTPREQALYMVGIGVALRVVCGFALDELEKALDVMQEFERRRGARF